MEVYSPLLLVGYWTLKPFNDHFQLEDSSLNVQYTPRHPNGPYQFRYDESLPIKCHGKQVWDNILNRCQYRETTT